MTGQANQEARSYLEMSDEEIMNLAAPAEVVEPVEEEEEEGAVAEASAPVEVEAEEEDGEALEGEDSEEAEETQDKEAQAEAPVEADAAKEASESEPTEAKAEEAPSAEVDYKKEYERLLAPFKANGRDIQVKSVDDAISLMQMGANYNKKMAALKPNLKLMKMMEKHDLLSEDKISYLIDLVNKNPDAINKLIKDSGVDPLDLDADKASEYRPKTYTVDDREIELDTILDEIQGTPSYTRTLDVVSNKWDAASKQVVANHPQLLKVINDHIERGVYDLIVREMESERMFGRLTGLSDLEAYRQVGDAIQARGGFDHLASRQGHQNPAPAQIVQPKPKQADEDKLREKRRAASSTKPAGPTVAAKEFNPLALSDEEFSKMVNDKYL